MTPAESPGRAVALSTHDLTGAHHLMLYSCEDCACPVSETSSRTAFSEVTPDASDHRLWVRGQDVLELDLDPAHRLLFNPLGSGGVVVLNGPALQIYQRFEHPVTMADALARGHDGALETIGRLGTSAMIAPVGQPRCPEFGDSQVLTAWMHVTDACNLRCSYCYLDKSGEKMDETTGLAAVEAVMNSAVRHGFQAVKLKYAGGEASLNYQLMLRMHAHAEELAGQHGMRLQGTLLSNGVRISPQLVGALKEKNIRVMISLDGIGEAHDAQRPFANGKPSFHLVEGTIGQLMKLGCAPHLSITISSLNAAHLSEVVRFALDRDLTFSFNFFRDNDCAASFPQLRYQEQEMISALLGAFEVIEEYMPPWSVLGSILDRGQLLQPRQRSCGVGQDYVVIDQNGRVAKCHMEIERSLGDIFTADPLTLVRSDQTTALNLLVDEKEGCRDCAWRYWCSGGCSVATFRATGRYDIKSPNCNIYKAIYPRALQLEGQRLLKYAPAVPASR
jgi:uncharacterized protein